ncbi:hypothetical protein SAMN05421509_102299 [Chromohalobacter canadensis]|uniref:PIN like domain-containing protein n=2 Tax=Chromohalobacter canadensis TaxID=141389 RepID=A0A285VJF6_9GAMM|nr:hypothetical protein SAMN05421509_102299 [Chromohalobacter canadensis]
MSSAEEGELWKGCVFVFDANILLNLYRYSRKTRKAFFEVLEKSKDRIWIPNRVAEEYLKNRPAAIVKQESPYENTIDKVEWLKEEVEKLKVDLESEYSHPFVKSEAVSKVEKALSDLMENVREEKSESLERMEADEIRENLSSFFDGKTGLGFSEDELRKICEEGEERYSNDVPPGFKDRGKENGGHVPKDEFIKYGDLIIWKEIIKYSKESKRDIVFVTDDNKEDWWVVKSGKQLGILPYLKSEFSRETGRKICMYGSGDFIDKADNLLNMDVGEDVSREIASVRENSARDLFNKAMANSHTANISQKYEMDHNLSAANGADKTIGDLIRYAKEKELNREEDSYWAEDSDMNIKEKVDSIFRDINYLNDRLDYIISNEPAGLTASDKELFGSEKKRIRRELMEKKVMLSDIYKNWR